MTSFRILIKQCPDCDCTFGFRVVSSCNTLGSTPYTDGFLYGPMYDGGSLVLSCPNCKRYYWVNDLPNQGSVSGRAYMDENLETPADDLPKVYKPDYTEYDALRRRQFWNTTEQERYVRLQAWWAFNMPHRRSATDDYEIPAEQEENLRELLPLLDRNTENDTIMKAEIHRELGEFDTCLELLDQSFDEDYLPAIKAIRDLASRKKRRVAAFEVPDPVWD